ncbi:iron chelate uptake ABC transporter family permease subunit [Acetobacteraceae bacterium ESL0709]|nr:iron chelate uptake ABC transporter family permease subunit [Acetobacteraceae bacterium ESL0697]MDF7677129.1 iron chelate uptake ABC transporter family permease subunit [Acetobacteraceae bacterium ESL0709]
MLGYDFMRHAFVGCFFVSLLAGTLGWFMILRHQIFAAHALPHIGFSGAAAAIWLKLSPFTGMIVSSLAAGLFMVTDDRKKSHLSLPIQREMMTGLVLAASLGIGVFCLFEANSASNQATNLLFGDVLGLSFGTLLVLACVTVFCLTMLVLLGRPLLFSTLAPELAEAQGVRLSVISYGFMAMVALASAACSEVAGALLSFSLMIGPAAAALRLGLTPVKGLTFSVLGALALSWGALICSWYTDFPVAFLIGIGAVGLYITAGWLRNLGQP